jgi:hypothetical protein
MAYKVTEFTAPFGKPSMAVVSKTYMSLPQAMHGMRKLAYHRLKQFAKLDTQAALDVMAAIDEVSVEDGGEVKVSNTGYILTLQLASQKMYSRK